MKNRTHNIKALLLSIVLAAVSFLIYKNLPDIPTSDPILQDLAAQTELLIPAVISALIVKKLGVLKPSVRGFKKGFRAGAYLLAIAAFTTVTWILRLAIGDTDISVPAGDIVLFVIFCLFIGISEELISRGIVLEGLLDYFGDDSIPAIRRAIVISGVLFGLLHLTNIHSASAAVAGIFLAVVNIADGILYSIIYVYSGRNLWPCVLIHALRDASSYLLSGYLCAATTATAESSGSAASAGSLIRLVVIAALTFAIDGLLMRKQKLQPFVRVPEESKAPETAAE